MRFALLAAAIFFAAPAIAQTPVHFPQKLDTPGFQGMIADTGPAYVSGQPTEAALRDLARLRQQLLASKWAALGRALGLANGLDSDSGKSPQEKLAALREKTDTSRWLALGRKLGLWKAAPASTPEA